VGLEFQWDRQLAGMAAVDAYGDPMPAATLESIARTRVALKGPLLTPVGGGFRSVNVGMRTRFDLYANVRPARTIKPGGRYDNVDIVLVRENTEGLYSGIENYVTIEGDERAAAQSVAVVSKKGAERIVRFAFEYAVAQGRKKVTLVHKANILKLSQGLFLEIGRKVAQEYEGRVQFEDRIIDATAMQLVLHPEMFDVLVTTNMFGDILSDEIAGLVGGLGLAPGANIGEKAAIFEAVHGTAPDIAGKGIANPGAQILAACMMLDHLGHEACATRIRNALEVVVRDGKTVTRDLGGTAGTMDFADAIVARMA
jgi:isocitrate dehydrogenase (NAD+)